MLEGNAMSRNFSKEACKENFITSKAVVYGKIEDEFEFSHKIFEEKFYKTSVIVKRLSGTEDFIPIVMSEKLITGTLKESIKGKYAEIEGQFCSENRMGEDLKSHLILYLLATNISISDCEDEQKITENYVFFDANICKTPIYRITPLGKKVTDLLIAVNRNKNVSDYIPCITWNQTALFAKYLGIGARIKVLGRIQSREYLKRFSPDSEEGENKLAYEVSIIKLKLS